MVVPAPERGGPTGDAAPAAAATTAGAASAAAAATAAGAASAAAAATAAGAASAAAAAIVSSTAATDAAGVPGAPAPAYPSLVQALRCALVALGALPWCLPLARGWLPLGALGAALDHLFLPMCHRMPERSLVLAGVMMPLCSRCAGIFAGIAIGAAIARPRFPMRTWRPLLMALSALMVADVAAQDLGLHPASHSIRVATGLAFGYGVAAAFLTQLARRAR